VILYQNEDSPIPGNRITQKHLHRRNTWCIPWLAYAEFAERNAPAVSASFLLFSMRHYNCEAFEGNSSRGDYEVLAGYDLEDTLMDLDYFSSIFSFN